MPFIRKHTAVLASALAMLDGLCIVAAYLIAVAAADGVGGAYFGNVVRYLPYLIAVLVFWGFEAVDQRLYVSRRSDALVPQLLMVTKTTVIAVLLSMFVMALLKEEGLDRPFVYLFIPAILLAIVFFRLVVRLSLWGLRRRGYNYRHILFVGANDRTARLAEIVLSHEQFGYHIEGFLDDDDTRGHFLERYSIPYLGPIRRLEQLLLDRVIDAVYVSLPIRSHYETIESVAHLCEGVGVPVRLVADLFPLRIATSRVVRYRGIPLLSLSVPQFETTVDLGRLPEMAVASILILILLPLYAVIAVLIKLDSSGPIWAREPRFDRRTRRRFNMFKFRTTPMAALPECAEASPAAAGANQDDTPTRLGKLLRRYALDELPQLFNVWRGEMTYAEPPPVLTPGAD